MIRGCRRPAPSRRRLAVPVLATGYPLKCPRRRQRATRSVCARSRLTRRATIARRMLQRAWFQVAYPLLAWQMFGASIADCAERMAGSMRQRSTMASRTSWSSSHLRIGSFMIPDLWAGSRECCRVNRTSSPQHATASPVPVDCSIGVSRLAARRGRGANRDRGSFRFPRSGLSGSRRHRLRYVLSAGRNDVRVWDWEARESHVRPFRKQMRIDARHRATAL